MAPADTELVQVGSDSGAFVTEDRISASKLRSKYAVQSLRHIFERVWPVDRKPVFSSLVRAIDELDREQRRRRKRQDAADRSG
jgi:hypothetical protein